MIGRRRFLQVAAASALVPAGAQAAEWRGLALGADVSVTLRGRGADRALRALPEFLDHIESTFSLYRNSEVTRLNTGGKLSGASTWLQSALALCDQLHSKTNGAFDPTVQRLWAALADGRETEEARAAIGWARVRHAGQDITLAEGQALTLNGMAQGFAADLVRDWLAAQGFSEALINLGEQAALGGPFRLGIADPRAGLVGQATLAAGQALAVSSPMATLVGGQPHILHPRGKLPIWSTVAVQAESAALADGWSTALVFMTKPEIRAARATEAGLGRVTLIDDRGDLQVI